MNTTNSTKILELSFDENGNEIVILARNEFDRLEAENEQLLAALEELFNLLEENQGSALWYLRKHYNAAKAAIAKARGEEATPMTPYGSPTEDYQTIDRLIARIEELEAALQPFADIDLNEERGNDGTIWVEYNVSYIRPKIAVTAVEQAAEALKGSPQ